MDAVRHLLFLYVFLALISLKQNAGISVLFFPVCGYSTVVVLFFNFLTL